MKSKTNILIIALVAVIVVIGAFLIFGGSDEIVDDPIVDEPVDTTVSSTGVITYVDLEGGFFAILGDDGVEYFPINLDPLLEVDGTSVSFSGEIVEDYMGIQMWGTPIELTEISEIIDLPEEIEDLEEAEALEEAEDLVE
jgi:hypothetical protein